MTIGAISPVPLPIIGIMLRAGRSMMHLPYAESAIAAVDKVRDYLLNPRHPANRGKAAGYTLFGFSRARWEALQTALLTHARTAAVAETVPTPYGKKYVLEGMLDAADGRTPWVRSVWKLMAGDPTPRFVTAHLIPPPKEPR